MNTQYREWLMEMVIKYGDKLIDTQKHNPFLLISNGRKWHKAFQMNHLIYFDNDEGQTIGYQLTPKATKYLERYDGIRKDVNT